MMASLEEGPRARTLAHLDPAPVRSARGSDHTLSFLVIFLHWFSRYSADLEYQSKKHQNKIEIFVHKALIAIRLFSIHIALI